MICPHDAGSVLSVSNQNTDRAVHPWEPHGENPLDSGQTVIQNMSKLGYSAVVTSRYRLDTRDKPALLFAMMSILASEQTRIVFEGNLASTELFKLEGASYEETGKLKRATISPKLDFIVLPLTATRLPAIEK